MKRWYWIVVGLVIIAGAGWVVFSLKQPVEMIKIKPEIREDREAILEPEKVSIPQGKTTKDEVSRPKGPLPDKKTAREIKRLIKHMEAICAKSEGMEAIGWGGAEARNRLAEIGGPAVPQILEVITDKSKDWRMRNLLVSEVLSEIKDERIIPALTNILKDKDEVKAIRVSSAWALGIQEDPRAVEPLIDIIYSTGEAPLLYDRAIMSLGAIGDKRATEHLIGIIEDKDKRILWYSTALALGGINDKRAVEPLIAAMEKHNLNAAMPLANIGGDRAIEYLVEKCNTKPDVVLVQALGHTEDPRAVKPLIAALKNQTTLVNRRAAKALGEIGGAQAIQALEEALTYTKDRGDRRIIALELKKLTGQDYEY